MNAHKSTSDCFGMHTMFLDACSLSGALTPVHLAAQGSPGGARGRCLGGSCSTPDAAFFGITGRQIASALLIAAPTAGLSGCSCLPASAHNAHSNTFKYTDVW